MVVLVELPPDPEFPDPPDPELEPEELFLLGATVVVVVDEVVVDEVLAISVSCFSSSTSSSPPGVSAASTIAKVVGGSVGRSGAGTTSAVSTGSESRTRTRAVIKTTAPVSANRWERRIFKVGATKVRRGRRYIKRSVAQVPPGFEIVHRFDDNLIEIAKIHPKIGLDLRIVQEVSLADRRLQERLGAWWLEVRCESHQDVA